MKTRKKAFFLLFAVLFAAAVFLSCFVVLSPRDKSGSPDAECATGVPFPECREPPTALGSRNGDSPSRPIKSDVRAAWMRMEETGAPAEILLVVADEGGNPLPEVSVSVWFSAPDGVEPVPPVCGLTDGRGCFLAKGKTNFSCLWEVSKKGFHSSRGREIFSNALTETAAANGTWTEKPRVVKAELRKSSFSDFAYGNFLTKPLRFAPCETTGFDFSAGDFVFPAGTGKTAHVFFRTEGSGGGWAAVCRGGILTNRLVISVPDGGIRTFTERSGGYMPFVSTAPNSFPASEVEFELIRSRDEIFVDALPKPEEYIVFKTGSGTPGEPFHVGLIRKLEFWPGGLRMEYFFNREPGSIHTDADVPFPETAFSGK